MCNYWDIAFEERRITINEVYSAYQEGKLKEVFGTGTAAVVSPVGKLRWKDEIMTINNGEIGEYSQKFYDTITGIQLEKPKINTTG